MSPRSRTRTFAVLCAVAVIAIGLTGTSAANATAAANAVIKPVPASQWKQIVAVGAWHKGCPVSQGQLRRVEVNYHGFDGATHRGVLVVNADVAPSVAAVLTTLFTRNFPIHRMQPIEAFKGDDNASMAADNTSAYNCRRASQANAAPTASPHANGRAIDLNPYENPWIDSRCNCYQPDAYYGTHRTGKGVINAGGVVYNAFINAGFIWQDNATTDFQHFDTGYPSRPFFGVAAAVGNSTQLITVKAHGTYATVATWNKTTAGWRRAVITTHARIGANGLVAGSARHQGTNTTPTGTYTLTQAFGISPDPGTTLPYHRVSTADWWVEDNASKYYNSLRRSSQGGFRTSLPESSVNGSEHLISHKTQYQYAVVIDYNMHPAVRYRGAGIFLHVSDGHPTAGCVSVPKSTMITLLRWLRPTAHPRIAIGS